MQASDDPPFLSVGTEVSAKYRGAFCEATIKIAKRLVKCKVCVYCMCSYVDRWVMKGMCSMYVHVYCTIHCRAELMHFLPFLPFLSYYLLSLSVCVSVCVSVCYVSLSLTESHFVTTRSPTAKARLQLSVMTLSGAP